MSNYSELLLRISSLSIILFLPIIIILTNTLSLTYNGNFYLKTYQKLKVYEKFENDKVVTNATEELLSYFRGKKELEHNIFSQQAKIHLRDVKSLLNSASIVNYLALTLVIISSLLLLIKGRWTLLVKSAFIGSILTVIITFFLFSLSVFDFSFFFEKFHLISFSNNFWLFPGNDNLIKLFPESFFVNFLFRLTLNIIITAILFIISTALLNSYVKSLSKNRPS